MHESQDQQAAAGGALPLLQDRESAAEYLSENLATGNPMRFFFALRNVIEANGGIQRFAAVSGVDEVALQTLLREPVLNEIHTLQAALDALNMQIVIEHK